MQDQPVSWMLLIAGCFLLGAIPFSYLSARVRTGRDLRQVGSGNPGATNALRTAGPGAAFVGLALDTGKGFVPVWLARGAELPSTTVATVAVACVLGHVLSPFLGFRGGKGVATGFGALTALSPIACALAAVVFVLTVGLSRMVSVGSMVAVALLPLLWLLADRLGFPPAAGRAGWWAATAIAALVIGRHFPNLRRIAAGTESRFGRGAA